jgi:hypothetical protein
VALALAPPVPGLSAPGAQGVVVGPLISSKHQYAECSSPQEVLTMKRLLRILFTVRGLVLASTLLLAAAGGYLNQGTAAPVESGSSHPDLQVHAMARSEVPATWNINLLCTPVSLTHVVLPCGHE